MKTNWTVFLAAATLATMVGCGKPGGSSDSTSPSAGTGSGGAATTTSITAVQSKLKSDPDLATIKVSEQNGSIQLDGTVKDSATKDKAEKVTGDVLKEQKSTGGVLNNIQIAETPAAK